MRHYWNKDENPEGLPEVQFDYTYGKMLKENDKDMVTILTKADMTTGAMCLVQVRKEGEGDGYAVSAAANWCRDLPWAKVMLFGDGESSLVALMRALREIRKDQVVFSKSLEEKLADDDSKKVMEEKAQVSLKFSPAESHQSIGGAEGGHSRGVGLVRTYIADLEEKYKIKMSSKHVLVPWTIRHSGWVKIRFEADESGVTPYKKLYHKDYTKHILELGEMVLWQRSAKNLGSKFERRFLRGL